MSGRPAVAFPPLPISNFQLCGLLAFETQNLLGLSVGETYSILKERSLTNWKHDDRRTNDSRTIQSPDRLHIPLNLHCEFFIFFCWQGGRKVDPIFSLFSCWIVTRIRSFFVGKEKLGLKIEQSSVLTGLILLFCCCCRFRPRYLLHRKVGLLLLP